MWPRRFFAFLIVFIVGSVLITLITNAIGWTKEPWWLAATRGAILGFGLPALEFATSKGWIDGVFFSPSQQAKFKQRRDELEQQRQDALSEFKEKKQRDG